MGYFSNGTEGMIYDDQFCSKCVNQDDEGGCPVMDLHLLYNGEEDKDLFLDWFIPRDKQGYNEECKMFHQRTEDSTK